MFYVITQHTENVDPSKGLIDRFIKATCISHLTTRSSQDLESVSYVVFKSYCLSILTISVMKDNCFVRLVHNTYKST
jgi:hypothetical protein